MNTTEFKVEPIDFVERNNCRVCGTHRNFHLATTDHSFVPGDAWMAEIRASELMPGDTVASVRVPRQRTSSNEETTVWIYRRR
jgi:hypothetical protein